MPEKSFSGAIIQEVRNQFQIVTKITGAMKKLPDNRDGYSDIVVSNRPLKNVFEAADTRQKQAKERSLCLINEHFEPVFNTAAATQMVLTAC